MAEATYTLLSTGDSIIAQGMSRPEAVKRMFFEGGFEIEFRPYDEEDQEICLFYRIRESSYWESYPLNPHPQEPLTEDHYYRDAIKNWDDPKFYIIPDAELEKYLSCPT